jgi:hypothetical protein
VSQCEDGGVVGAELVVDDDAALHRQAGRAGEGDLGADTAGQDHEIALDLSAVGEADTLDAAGPDHPAGEGTEVDADPERLHRTAQDVPTGRVQLHVHEVPHAMHHVDVDALLQQPAGCLEAQQATAHDDGPRGALGAGRDGRAVLESAEHEHAVQQVAAGTGDPVHRRHNRDASCGEDQGVVGGRDPVLGVHDLRRAVDARDGAAEEPARTCHLAQGDLAGGALARQHVRQQDPVVGGTVLGAEDGDLELGVAP